jgi:hypothetical protein
MLRGTPFSEFDAGQRPVRRHLGGLRAGNEPQPSRSPALSTDSAGSGVASCGPPIPLDTGVVPNDDLPRPAAIPSRSVG